MQELEQPLIDPKEGLFPSPLFFFSWQSIKASCLQRVAGFAEAPRSSPEPNIGELEHDTVQAQARLDSHAGTADLL